MKIHYLSAVQMGLTLGLAMPVSAADAAKPAPAAVAQMPANIAAWQNEMVNQANVVFADLLKEAETADEKAELEKSKKDVLAAIAKAADAAVRLNDARQAYYEAAFSRAGEKKADMMKAAPVFAEDAFPADADMLSLVGMWLPEEARGEEDGACNLRAPAIAQDAGAIRPADTAPMMAYRAALQVHFTEQLLDRVAKSIADSYTENPEDADMVMNPVGDPCTGVLWEKAGDKITPADAANRKKLGELFAATESAWQAYRKAMLELICPAHLFYGTAFPLNNSSLDATLLNGRDEFLGTIARGFEESEYADSSEDE